MLTENILETVDRIETAISRIERILYGEPPVRPNGLLVEFEGLRCDVQGLRADVRTVQSRRPNVLLWVAGFVSFFGATIFLVIGLMNTAGGHRAWDLPGGVALWLAAILAAVSLFLLLGGFGWLDGRGA